MNTIPIQRSTSPRHRLVGILALAGATIFLLTLLIGQSRALGAGNAPSRIVPRPNSTVTSAPEIGLVFDLPTADANATVFGADHTVVASGPMTTLVGSANAVSLALPELSPGIYTVSWTVATENGGPEAGTFAFGIDPSGEQPETLTAPRAHFQLKPTKNVVVSWVPWLAIMIFVGTLILRFFVVGPTARRFSDAGLRAETERIVNRRLTVVAAVAIAVFVPATLTELAFSAGDDSFAYGKIWHALTADGEGHIWFARLVFTALAAAIMVVALRRREDHPATHTLLRVGLALGLLELIARVVPSSVPVNKPRTFFGDVFTLAHIVGAAIWVGGLVGLLALAAGKVVPRASRSAFWPGAVRRFSQLALFSVGVVALSGAWLTWVHVGTVGQFFSTLYGRTLVVKLLLVGGLVALGGFNHLWLKPRLETLRAARQHDGVVHLIERHFRRAVAAEVILGVAVLFVVPLLSGSARNQDFQTKAADISQTASADATTIRLNPSALAPGLVDYDVTVTGAEPTEVVLTFSSNELGVPAQSVVAEALGAGHFLATGMYTPMAGEWQVAVDTDANANGATFNLQVAPELGPLPRAKPPKITSLTWFFGLLLVAFVGYALTVTTRLARRLTNRRLAMLGTLGPRPDEPAVATADDEQLIAR